MQNLWAVTLVCLLLELLPFKLNMNIAISAMYGQVWWRCRVFYFTRASIRNWLTVGQGLLSFVAGKDRGGNVFISSVSSLSFLFLILPCPALSYPLLCLFSLSLGDDTKWPTGVDMPLNQLINQSINQSIMYLCSLEVESHLRYFHEISQKSKAPWEDVQNKRTLALVNLFLELPPFEHSKYWKWPFLLFTCVSSVRWKPFEILL